MSKPNNRRVKMAEFKAQITEQVVGEGSLIPVELPTGDEVLVKIAVNLGDDDDFAQRLQAADDSHELALIVLGAHPELSAEQQWEMWSAAGYDERDLAAVVGAETNAARDRLAAFRYRS